MVLQHPVGKKSVGLLGFLMIMLLAAPSLAAGVSRETAAARTLRTMARIYMTYGDYDKARDLAEQAAASARQNELESGEEALCLIDLATVYGRLNRLDESDRLFREGVALQKQALFEDHPYVAQTYRMLSDVQRRAGNLEAAEQSLTQAVTIMLNHCDIQSGEMAPFILETANLCAAKGEYEQAEVNYRTVLDMTEQSHGSRHLMMAHVLDSMARCSLMQANFEAADRYVSRSLSIQRQLFGRQNPLMVDTWLTKARICRAQGRIDRSEYYLSQATASVEKSRNVMTLARVYQQVREIRTADMVAAVTALD